jgi:hypothetical protein
MGIYSGYFVLVHTNETVQRAFDTVGAILFPHHLSAAFYLVLYNVCGVHACLMITDIVTTRACQYTE